MPRSRRGRTAAGVLVAVLLLVGAASTAVVLAVDLVRVGRDRANASLAADEAAAWALPPSVFGRVDAEVLDVDRVDGTVSMDVAYVSAGRTQNVAWVDVTHLSNPPEPGDVVPVAYDPHHTEIVFDLDDPGLSDPQGNGYLAWSPVPPPAPQVGHLAVRAALAVGLTLAGAGVLVATVAAAGRQEPALSAPAGP